MKPHGIRATDVDHDERRTLMLTMMMMMTMLTKSNCQVNALIITTRIDRFRSLTTTRDDYHIFPLCVVAHSVPFLRCCCRWIFFSLAFCASLFLRFLIFRRYTIRSVVRRKFILVLVAWANYQRFSCVFCDVSRWCFVWRANIRRNLISLSTHEKPPLPRLCSTLC